MNIEEKIAKLKVDTGDWKSVEGRELTDDEREKRRNAPTNKDGSE